MDADDLDDVLRRLEERARGDADLARELSSSARRFHGGAELRSDLVTDAAAALRHREYFLLERPSERFGLTPILHFAPEFEAEDEEAIEALCGSHTSLFEVLALDDDAEASVRVEDLASGRQLDLADARFAGATSPGDVLVGRVFPERAGGALLSSGAARIGDPALTLALKRDLASFREQHPRASRLSQLELEDLFFRSRSQPVRALEHIEAALQRFLREAGSELADAEDLKKLAHEAPTAGAFLGPLLEELAFDTTCDLDAARRLALEYWQAHRALHSAAERRSGAESARPMEKSSGAESEARISAVEAFERGRAAGRSLDDLFQELESALEIDPDEDGDEEVGAEWVPVGIAPILEEFAWDRSRLGEPLEAEELSQARAMAEAWDRGPRRPQSVDEIDTAMLSDYALVDLPRWIREQQAGSAEQELAALARGWDYLERFCLWLDEEHATVLAPHVRELRESSFDASSRALRATYGATPRSAGTTVWVRALGPLRGASLELEPLDLGRNGKPRSFGSREVRVGESIAEQLARAGGIGTGDLLRVELSGAGGEVKLSTVSEVLPSGAEESLRARGAAS